VSKREPSGAYPVASIWRKTFPRIQKRPISTSVSRTRNLVFSSVDRELPDASDTVRDMFGRRGAWRRFKDYLWSCDMLDQRYDIETEFAEEALRERCLENEIPLRDSQSFSDRVAPGWCLRLALRGAERQSGQSLRALRQQGRRRDISVASSWPGRGVPSLTTSCSSRWPAQAGP
jgi:hypothetical protein